MHHSLSIVVLANERDLGMRGQMTIERGFLLEVGLFRGLGRVRLEGVFVGHTHLLLVNIRVVVLKKWWQHELFSSLGLARLHLLLLRASHRFL